jgi:hypothetical protein
MRYPRMNDETRTFLNEFDDVIENCERFCFAARAREFQVEAIEKLQNLKKTMASMKARAIQASDEDSANCLLSLELAASALENELGMWVAFKDDNPDEAWDKLVTAQSCSLDAIRAHEIANLAVHYVEKLELLEKLLFPSMMFMSPGVIILKSECTICGLEYGECDHIKGRPYMGEICARKLTEVEVREISFVDNPANKRARVFAISEGDKMRDVLSWRERTGSELPTMKGSEEL